MILSSLFHVHSLGWLAQRPGTPGSPIEGYLQELSLLGVRRVRSQARPPTTAEARRAVPWAGWNTSRRADVLVLTADTNTLPTTPEQGKTSLVLRVRGDPDSARRTLLDALTKVDPAVGGITTMRMMAGLEPAILGVVFWLAVSAGRKSACGWRSGRRRATS